MKSKFSSFVLVLTFMFLHQGFVTGQCAYFGSSIPITGTVNLTTSGIPNSSSFPWIYQTTSQCIHIMTNSTLVVDQSWNLTDVNFQLENGASILVTADMNMNGGGLYSLNYNPAVPAIEVDGGFSSTGATLESLYGTGPAIMANAGSMVNMFFGYIFSFETAIVANDALFIEANGESWVAVGEGIISDGTDEINVRNSTIATNASILRAQSGGDIAIKHNNLSVAGVPPYHDVGIRTDNNWGNLSITNNTMTFSAVNIGVYAFGGGVFDFTGNNVIVSSGAAVTTAGIAVQNNYSGVDISGNPSMTFNGVGKSVSVFSSAAPEVSNNNIYFNQSFQHAGFGIEIGSCTNALVTNNQLYSGKYANNFPVFTKGLVFADSGGEVSYNTFNNMDIGVEIWGYCSLDDNFYENNFNFPMLHALNVTPSGRMGQQCQSNNWNGTSALCQANSGCISDSPFIGFSTPGSFFPPLWFMFGSCRPELSGRSSGLETTDKPSGTETITISPNPASDLINLSLPYLSAKTTVELRDMAGKLINKISVDEGNTSTILDVSEVSPGLYLVNVLSDNYRHTEKVVVSR